MCVLEWYEGGSHASLLNSIIDVFDHENPWNSHFFFSFIKQSNTNKQICFWDRTLNWKSHLILINNDMPMSWIVSDYCFSSKFYIRNVTFWKKRKKKRFKTIKYVFFFFFFFFLTCFFPTLPSNHAKTPSKHRQKNTKPECDFSETSRCFERS